MKMCYELHKKSHQNHRRCARKSPTSDSSSTSSTDSETLSAVQVFRRNASKIKIDNLYLKEKFQKEIWIPNKNDMEWCSFCLGLKLCREIYGDRTEGERATSYRKLPDRRFPLLSIVLHLHQDKMKLLLHYLHQWFLILGLKDIISMWMYALLSCLDESSVDNECVRFFKTLYEDLKIYFRNCKKWQKPRATLIMDILEDYFLVDVSENDSE